MALIVGIPENMADARRYTIDVIMSRFLGLEYRVCCEAGHCVTISSDEDRRKVRVADIFFSDSADHWLEAETLPAENWPSWNLSTVPDLTNVLKDSSVPVIYGRPFVAGEYLRISGDTIEIGLDIFGSAFFLLTRYEEAVSQVRDEYGRFPARASLLSINGYIARPLVDEYVEILWRILQMQWPQLKRRDRHYRLLLSHDVDYPSAYSGKGVTRVGLGVAADLMKRRNMELASRRISGYLAYRRGDHGPDIYNTFDFIMDVSESAGLPSAFYFIPLVTNPKRDGNYSLDEPWIKTLLREMVDRGHEVGVHGSYDSYRSGEQLLAEREKMNQELRSLKLDVEAIGGRQHYLRWEPRESWALWCKAGFSYDSSVGFAEIPGFRCGTCREFPVYDLVVDQPLPGLVERPLIAMDVTFSSYMKLGEDATYQKITDLGAICRWFDGNMSLLWHNNSLIDTGQRRFYKSLVRKLS